MRRESNLELKVGVFVLVAFIVFTSFIFSVSDFSIFEKGKNFRVIFGFANGLKRFAPVRVAGVDAGVVRDIKVSFDQKENKTKVNVDIWLKNENEIPSDSIVLINQLGMLGEKYLEIIPGVNTKEFLKAGNAIVGRDPIAMEQISMRMNELSAKIEDAVDGFNTIIRNEKNQKSLEKTLESISIIASNIKDGKGTIGKFLLDNSIHDDLQALTADLKANPWKLLYRPKDKKRR